MHREDNGFMPVSSSIIHTLPPNRTSDVHNTRLPLTDIVHVLGASMVTNMVVYRPAVWELGREPYQMTGLDMSWPEVKYEPTRVDNCE
jgi:hypothetical protein